VPATSSAPDTGAQTGSGNGGGSRRSGYRQAVLRWLCALITGLVLTGFAFLLVTGDYINDGPVVASVTEDHGLHEGDLFVIAGWAVGVLSLGLLAMSPDPDRASR
jgi:hypothetical protein